MKRALQSAMIMLLLAATVFLAVATSAVVELRHTITDADVALAQASSKLNRTLDKLDGATVRQAKYWDDITRDTRVNLVETNRTLKSAHAFIGHLDERVNGELLPATTAAVKGNEVQLQSAIHDLDQLAIELRPAIENTAAATAHADQLLTDPALGQALKHIEASTSETAGIASDVHSMTSDLRDAEHDVLHPKKPSIALRIVYWVLGNGFKSAVTGGVQR